jgi:hypothetical protein
MYDYDKETVSPRGTPPSHDEVQANGGEGSENQRVVEYLRQRLATVVAAGTHSEPAEDYIERSHFSMDLSDDSGTEDPSAFGESDNGGGSGTPAEAAYPNLRTVSWEDDELDPAWIIDRYCSWQESDLEDAMMEDEEASEVNRLLSEEWREWNEAGGGREREREREQEIGIGEGAGADANPNGGCRRKSLLWGACDGLRLIMSRFSHDEAPSENCKDNAGLHAAHASFEESLSLCISTIRRRSNARQDVFIKHPR